MVNTIPAITGKVKEALSWASIPKIKNMLKSRAILAGPPLA